MGREKNASSSIQYQNSGKDVVNVGGEKPHWTKVNRKKATSSKPM